MAYSPTPETQEQHQRGRRRRYITAGVLAVIGAAAIAVGAYFLGEDLSGVVGGSTP